MGDGAFMAQRGSSQLVFGVPGKQAQARHFVGILFHASQLSGQVRTEFHDLDTTGGAQRFAIEQIGASSHVEFD